jgi:two-component system, OmpR family, response regulator
LPRIVFRHFSVKFQPLEYNKDMRILVIEDEHRIAASLKKGLEQEHYTVDVTYDGVEGYDLASSEEYDLIILDLMLPEKPGMEICRDLRINKNNTPILILTARDQTQDKVLGLDTGADDYLTKPFSFEELLARVRALTRRPKVTIEDVLKVEDLTLDTKKYTIKRGSVDIQLSGKEFSLLEYIMRHPKQILTKEQIIGHVWNYDADILPNTVEVYIKNLRSKIDVPFRDRNPLIQTVRGFGYKIGR